MHSRMLAPGHTPTVRLRNHKLQLTRRRSFRRIKPPAEPDSGAVKLPTEVRSDLLMAAASPFP